MLKIAQKFTVELTTEEIELLTTALHGEYKFIRKLCEENANPREAARLHEKTQAVRALRNSFSGLINRFYMGEDA